MSGVCFEDTLPALQPSPGESPARTYTRHLIHLHELFVAWQSESPQADAIRDEMDRPWYAMTKSEQELMSRLSEAPYAKANGSPIPILIPPPLNNNPFTSRAQKQAEVWQEAGFPEVALLYLRSDSL